MFWISEKINENIINSGVLKYSISFYEDSCLNFSIFDSYSIIDIYKHVSVFILNLDDPYFFFNKENKDRFQKTVDITIQNIKIWYESLKKFQAIFIEYLKKRKDLIINSICKFADIDPSKYDDFAFPSAIACLFIISKEIFKCAN